VAESPPTPDAPHHRAVRWGIVGTGGIAAAFAADLRIDPEAGELVAVASRSPERAEAFAARVGAPRVYGTYEQLAADSDVDVVYVAVPHTAHHSVARLALEAGKAVLVEKPFTVNRREAQDLVETARSHGLFLMEAMWTRFLPHMVEIRRLIAQGRLGELRLVLAEFGVRFDYDPASRMFDPALGGGALLDLGVYPISFASMVLGTPTEVTATADFGPTGVDAQTAVTLRYPGDRQAVTVSSMEAWLPNGATIAGRDARIDVDGMFYRPASFTLTDRHGEQERFDGSVPGGGMQFEALEVARCLRAGLTESPILSLEETLSIMSTLDQARAAIGLRYPGEEAT
jgi:predicted dehydrogenase